MKPRPWLFSGHLIANGLLFDTDVTPDAKARILRLWEPGARVVTHADGFLLVFATPRRLHSGTTVGTPVVTSRFGGYTAVPGAEPPSGALTRWRHGELRQRDLGAVADVAGWIDLNDWSIPEVKPLGLAPARPEGAAAVLSQREVFATIIPEIAVPLPVEVVYPAWARWLGANVGRLLNALQAIGFRFLNSRSATGNSGTARDDSGSEITDQKSSPPAPSWADRFEAWLASFAWYTGLLALLQARQREHIDRMIDLFDSPDLTEALRHAIPIGGEGDGAAYPALGLPGVRDKLAVTRGFGGGGALGLGKTLHQQVQETYRRAVERLVRAEDYDKAAFVLAELLGEPAAAVALLEKHQRWELAAQIADTRDLAPGVRVRLWWLAGNEQRAIDIALARKAWLSALQLMGATHVDAANRLRTRWMKELIAAGSLAAAIDVGKPVVDLHDAVIGLMKLVCEEGGAPAGTMLKELADFEQAEIPWVEAQLEEWLRRDDPEAFDVRRTLFQAFRTWGPREYSRFSGTTRRALARRALIDDLKLAPFARQIGDPMFNFDAQRGLRVLATNPLPDETHLRLVPSNVGAAPVCDVALFANGDLLLAWGEAGGAVVRPDGVRIATIREPIRGIVMSHDRTVALLVAPRGDWLRVARYEHSGGVVSYIGDVLATRYARSYDGLTWFVGTDTEILHIDVVRFGRPLWRVGNLEPVTMGLPQTISLELRTGDDTFAFAAGQEWWVYRITGHSPQANRLLSRDIPPSSAFGAIRAQLMHVSEDRRWVSWNDQPHRGTSVAHRFGLSNVSLRVRGGGSQDWVWLANQSETDNEWTLSLHERTNSRFDLRFSIRLGPLPAVLEPVYVDLAPPLAVIATAAGHLVVLDLAQRVVRHHLRPG